MSKINVAKTEPAEPLEKPARKPWSTPQVITAKFDSTESGSVNIPEASGGLLTS